MFLCSSVRSRISCLSFDLQESSSTIWQIQRNSLSRFAALLMEVEYERLVARLDKLGLVASYVSRSARLRSASGGQRVRGAYSVGQPGSPSPEDAPLQENGGHKAAAPA